MITVTTNSETPIKFISSNGEELMVTTTTEEFIIEYLDSEDVVQTWRFRDGFVRRLSLKGANIAIDNVVPTP